MKTTPSEKTVTRSSRSPNRSVAERSRFLRRWEASGLAAEAFAKLHPVKAQSLYRWRMEERSARPASAEAGAPTFRELDLSKISVPAPSRALTIVLRSAALEIALSGIGLDERLPALIKALKREVFDV